MPSELELLRGEYLGVSAQLALLQEECVEGDAIERAKELTRRSKVLRGLCKEAHIDVAELDREHILWCCEHVERNGHTTTASVNASKAIGDGGVAALAAATQKFFDTYKNGRQNVYKGFENDTDDDDAVDESDDMDDDADAFKVVRKVRDSDGKVTRCVVSSYDTLEQRTRVVSKSKSKRHSAATTDLMTNRIKEARARVRVRIQEKKEEKLLSAPPDSELLNVADVMKDYQLDGLTFVVANWKKNMSSLLQHGMGTGKTLLALACIQEFCLTYERVAVVLICPAMLLAQWQHEHSHWSPYLSFAMTSNKDCTVDAWMQDHLSTHQVYLCTPEYFNRNTDTFSKLAVSLPKVLVCVDEAHQFLSKSSNVFYSSLQLLPSLRLLLTATPLQNSLTDIFEMVNLLEPSLFKDITIFNHKFVRPIMDGKERNATPSMRSLGKRYMRLLMALMDHVVHVKDSSWLHKSLPLKLEFRLSVYVGKLDSDLQSNCLTSPVEYLSKLEDVIRPIKFAAITQCIDYIRASFARPYIIVFSHRKVILQQIVSHTSDAMLMDGDVPGKKRDAIIEHFKTNGGVLCLSKKIGCSGLNLPEATHLILVESSWNPVDDHQAVGRMFRVSQVSSTYVYRFVASNTIEERAYKYGLRKDDLVSAYAGATETEMSEPSLFTDVNMNSLESSGLKSLSDEELATYPVLAKMKRYTAVRDITWHDTGTVREYSRALTDDMDPYEKTKFYNELYEMTWSLPRLLGDRLVVSSDFEKGDVSPPIPFFAASLVDYPIDQPDFVVHQFVNVGHQYPLIKVLEIHAVSVASGEAKSFYTSSSYCPVKVRKDCKYIFRARWYVDDEFDWSTEHSDWTEPFVFERPEVGVEDMAREHSYRYLMN